MQFCKWRAMYDDYNDLGRAARQGIHSIGHAGRDLWANAIYLRDLAGRS